MSKVYQIRRWGDSTDKWEILQIRAENPVQAVKTLCEMSHNGFGIVTYDFYYNDGNALDDALVTIQNGHRYVVREIK